MINGVDVSAYQPNTYSVAGLDFVFVKATEGLTYTNPRMAAQVKRARDAGLVVGFYHYPHMANDPVAEANYFLNKAPIQDGDIIVFDWEGYDPANKGVSRSRQIAYRDAWLAYVKGRLRTHRVGMYCNTDYWLNIDQTGNCGDFLWIATGGRAAGDPGIKDAWTFHQYSTANNIDHDVANFPDRAALAAWAAGTTPQETDMTPDQATQLQQLHDNLLSITSLTEKDAKGNPAVHGAGYYLAHIHFDALKIVAAEAAQTAAITAMATALGKVDSAIDVPALVAEVQKAVADGAAKALEGLSINVDVTSPAGS